MHDRLVSRRTDAFHQCFLVIMLILAKHEGSDEAELTD